MNYITVIVIHLKQTHMHTHSNTNDNNIRSNLKLLWNAVWDEITSIMGTFV